MANFSIKLNTDDVFSLIKDRITDYLASHVDVSNARMTIDSGYNNLVSVTITFEGDDSLIPDKK